MWDKIDDFWLWRRYYLCFLLIDVTLMHENSNYNSEYFLFAETFQSDTYNKLRIFLLSVYKEFTGSCMLMFTSPYAIGLIT